MRRARTSRRRFLSLVLVGTAGTALLAACAQPAPPTPAPTAAPKPTAPPPQSPATSAPPTQAPTAAVAAPTTPAGPAVAATPATAAAAKPAGRPDWQSAAKPFAGRSLNGLVSTEDSGKLVGKLAEEFGQANGIKIKVEQLPVPAYPAKLQTELVARTGNLDFILMLIADVAQYAKAGLLTPLEPFLQDPQYPDYDLTDFPDNALDAYARRNGKVYGLPALGGAQIMYYRKDLFEEAGLKPPTTWQEVYDAAKKLRKGDVWGAAIDLKGASATRYLSAFPPGLQWLDKDMKLSSLRDPRTQANFDLWARMLKEDLLPKDTLANDLNAIYALFQQGKAAMLPLAWPVAVPTMVDPAVSKVGDKAGFVPLPGGSPAGSGWTLVVPSDSKQREAAFLAASWVTNKQQSARQITEAGITDAAMRRSVFNDTLKTEVGKRPFGKYELEGLTAFTQSWPNARFIPLIPEWPKLQDVITPAIQKVVGGQAAAKDALNQAADEGEKILEAAGYYKK